MNDIFVTEVLATRLSHDLSGNIGAVANAVELMNDGDDDDREDIANILNFSSKALNSRLKFFRLCFGLSNATVKTVEELKTVIEDYLLTLGNPKHPIGLDLLITTPKIYKLIMPSVMMMADTIVKGGKISVGQTDSSLLIAVNSNNPLDTEKLSNISKILNGENPENSASPYAPLYYLITYLNGSGVKVRLDENALVITG